LLQLARSKPLLATTNRDVALGVRSFLELCGKVLGRCPWLDGHYFRRLCGILAMSANRSRKRNQGLFEAALAMRDLVKLDLVGEGTAVELLLETAHLNGYVVKHGKVRGVKRALRTIQSGLSYS
jgi:hypothetical protein